MEVASETGNGGRDTEDEQFRQVQLERKSQKPDHGLDTLAVSVVGSDMCCEPRT